jgi:hypothetical protein
MKCQQQVSVKRFLDVVDQAAKPAGSSEGVFRRDHVFNDEVDPFSNIEEVYRFTYQRFSDHLIVKVLLQKITTVDNAFKPDGPLYFLIEDRNNYAWSSLWSALAAQLPENFPGKELIDLLPEEPNNHQLNNLLFDTFEQSLLWRANTAFSERTRELFNMLPTDWNDPRIDIIVRLATVREHLWNAENFLDKSLKRLSMPKRDALWTVQINKAAEDDRHPLWELIRWSLTANLFHAETETLRLAAITLAWIFTSSHRPVRDTATKALISLFTNRPEIIPVIVGQFSNIDDLYVMERICAAAFGAITRGIDQPEIKAASYAVYNVIFDLDTPPLNINLRDYARAIIEYALEQNCLDERVEIDKCRPPYRSEWPLHDVTEDELEALAEKAGDREILSSAFRWGGDFGTYEIEYKVHHFTKIMLNQSRPLNEEERKTEFNDQIEGWSPKKHIAYLELETAVNEKADSWRMDPESEGGFKTSYSQVALDLVECREKTFLNLLDETELEAYNNMILPVLMPDRYSYEERSLPKFDEQFAKRWITKRAYDYGWCKELFPKDQGRSDDYSRNRPKVERIGKKYQWLALFELLARLSDNVWTIDKWPERAMTYDHPATDWFVRDIEPSILHDPPQQQENKCWWKKLPLGLDLVEDKNLRTWPFVEEPPNIPDWMDVVDTTGTPWLLLYGLFSSREERPDKDLATLAFRRHTFVRISTILVKSGEVKTVINKLRGYRLSDPSGHECPSWTDGPFLCEYPWRNSWEYRDTVFEESSFGKLSPRIRYIRPVAEHTWESHLDLSLTEGFSSHIPHPWMAEKMGLKHNFGQPGCFISRQDNQTIFVDPSIGYSGSSAGLIDKVHFFEFLKNEGLECIWIVAGERNSYPTGNHGDYACRYFASVYRWSEDKWKGYKWHHDENREI